MRSFTADGNPIPAAFLVILVLAVASCSYLKYEPVTLLPPTIPGASYVGMAACATCHEKESQYFRFDTHFTVFPKLKEDEVSAKGCESCHGPGSLHVEGGGNRKKIIRYSPEMCYSCHVDKRGQFQLQHHHPVPEGHMSCMDCHDAHGKDVRATSGARLKRQEEKCFACHKQVKGPFVFEHDAMRDGCQTCHQPHGSVHDKMLVAGQSTTCLRCHWEQAFDSGNRLGGVTHDFYIGRGEDCIDCHRAVHGSNIWRTLNR